MPPPPPPPPLPPPPSTATLDRRMAPPPPPPPPSLGGMSTVSAARPPPPAPAARRPPPAPVAPVYRLSNLPPAPPVAPILPDTPRMSEELSPMSSHSPKFPSFTMDLPDITNVPRTRDSAFSSAGPPPPPRHLSRGSFSTLGAGFATENSGRESEVAKPWDKPLDFATMSVAPSSVAGDEDEDTGFDVPDRLTLGPGAVAARLDLQRCTIRVHKQLVDQIKTNSMKPALGGGKSEAPMEGEELSRCQGELWLKSRVPMMGWKKRYGSIVDHAYFGPVLFLFKYDAKGNVALHHSMMIVLVDSHVRLGKNSTTKDRDYRCEFVLKTTKRRYVIAANHTMRRDYWLRNLETIQQQASTSYA